MSTLSFRVVGTPAPQGSKSGFVNPRTQRIILTESSKKVKPWRQDVVAAAMNAAEEIGWNEPPEVIEAEITFWFLRPKSHYRTGRNSHILKPNAPEFVGTKPDLDKLLRSTFDALTTARVIGDDCRVVDVHATKRYAQPDQPAGADLHLTPLVTANLQVALL